MIYASAAAVIVAGLAFEAWRRYLAVEYPPAKDTPGLEARVARVEDRLTTIELQRGIKRSNDT